jgi:hypothetical protein
MTLVTVWITTCQSLRSADNGTLTSHTMMSATVARPPAPGRRRARHAMGRRERRGPGPAAGPARAGQRRSVEDRIPKRVFEKLLGACMPVDLPVIMVGRWLVDGATRRT